MTPYQRAQSLRLRLLREEIRGRIAPDTERVYETAQELWQVEDRFRFAIASRTNQRLSK